jgi:hypothetical protein
MVPRPSPNRLCFEHISALISDHFVRYIDSMSASHKQQLQTYRESLQKVLREAKKTRMRAIDHIENVSVGWAGQKPDKI